MKDEIHYIDRKSGETLTEDVPAGNIMRWLYGRPLGKATLFLFMKRKFVSAIVGRYMSSKRSQKRIVPFIENYKIDLNDYQVTDANQFTSFNDFFYRKINPEKRPLGAGVVSPADGKTLGFQHLKDVPTFFVKGQEFDITRFVGDSEIAAKYQDGAMVIIRLAPTDYHRYHFPASGKATESRLIKGHYYSVSPIALQKSLEIFCENKRTFSELSTEKHGDIAIIEVGATMVGSIFQTYNSNQPIKKGAEKGYFAFGGSTVVVLFEKGKVRLSADLLENTRNGFETQVSMGETIAE
ncbi:MAG: phosphatidylserine decarboxylase [Crocinitomicaceae bacterium]